MIDLRPQVCAPHAAEQATCGVRPRWGKGGREHSKPLRWVYRFGKISWYSLSMPACLRVWWWRVLWMHSLPLPGNLLRRLKLYCFSVSSRLNSQRGTSALDALFSACLKPSFSAGASNLSCPSELQRPYTWPFSVTALFPKLPAACGQKFQTQLMRRVNSTVTRQSSMLTLSVSRLVCKARRLRSLSRLVW